MRYFGLSSILVGVLVLHGCMSAQEHRAAVRDDTGDRITVGKVQREIRVGMTNAQVAEVLGSPNVVTTDEQRREVWVYDKVSTEYVHSSSSGGVSAWLFGGAPIGNGLGGGLGGAGADRTSGAGSTTQRTLTIVIKFDSAGLVRDLAYRQSSF